MEAQPSHPNLGWCGGPHKKEKKKERVLVVAVMLEHDGPVDVAPASDHETVDRAEPRESQP
jgi:hypothetical protein